MRAPDAVNTKDVLSDAESAQPTSRLITKKSGKPCRLLCDPQSLPPVPATATIRLPDAGKMSMETRHAVRDYFWDKYTQGEKRARERRWI